MPEEVKGIGSFITDYCHEGFLSVPKLIFTRAASLNLDYSDVGILTILFYLAEKSTEIDYSEQVSSSSLLRDAIDRGLRMGYIKLDDPESHTFHFTDDFLRHLIPGKMMDLLQISSCVSTFPDNNDTGLEKMLTSMQQDLIKKNERIRQLESEMRGKSKKKNDKLIESGNPVAEAKKRIFEVMENLLARPLDAREFKYIDDWFLDYELEEEAIILMLKNFYMEGKTKISYLNTVAKDWHNRGIHTLFEVEKEFEKRKDSKSIYEGIQRYLSFDRPLTVPERKLVNTWQDEWNFDSSTIFKACDLSVSSRKPSIGYINKILQNWKENGIPIEGEKSKRSCIANNKKNPVKGKIDDEFNEYDNYCRTQGIRAGKVRE